METDPASLHEALLQPSRENGDDKETEHYLGDVETPHGTPPSSSSRFIFCPSEEEEEEENHESTIANDTIDRNSGWLKLYSRTLHNYRWFLLGILLLLWPFGVLFHLHLHNITESTFRPIPGTPSGLAEDQFRALYSDNGFMDPMFPALYIVLTGVNVTVPHSVPYDEARNFSESLLQHLNTTCWKWPQSKTCDDRDWLVMTSFYSLYDAELHTLAQSTVLPNATIVQLQYSLPLEQSRHHKARVLALMDAMDDYQKQFDPLHFTVSYTGLRYFASDLAQSTSHDLIRMDVVVLPLALLLMGLVLPTANVLVLWIFPVVTMVSSVCLWSILLNIIGRFLHISTFTPTIMMSLTLGMGIDYTLFLLSRYLEERKCNNNKETSIRNMLRHSGHVLILSGLTLATTFVGLVILPLGMLKSVGIGAAIAILSSLIANLVLVPVLLHTRLGTLVVRNRTETTDDAAPPGEGSASFPRNSVFFRMSKHLLHKYRGIIVLLVTLQVLMPVAQYAFSVKSSISFDLLLPSDAPSLQVYKRVSKAKGVGSLNPYRILFDGSAVNTSMHSQKAFDVMHLVVDELQSIDTVTSDETIFSRADSRQEVALVSEVILQQMETDELCLTNSTVSKNSVRTRFDGISVLRNIRLPHSLFLGAKYCAQIEPYCPYELLHTIDVIDQQLTNENEKATIVTASLGVNPFSDGGIEWLEQARSAIDRLEETGGLNGIRVYIDGSASIAHDAVNAVYSSFPAMATVTTLVVFLLMGIFFKSIFVPFRSVVSISLTLAFSFGLTVLVFEKGIFNWTQIQLLTSVGNEMCWLVPVMGFSIIVGLALDYDVFLVSRILEYRSAGYEHKSSVALGLDSTGGIITAAGIIMVAAFGSLMFSSNPVLYQWSFLLTTAVLLDTFVVRTVVVPILTGLAGKRSWWPRRLPDEIRYFRELDEQEGADASISSLLRTLESTSEYEALRPRRE